MKSIFLFLSVIFITIQVSAQADNFCTELNEMLSQVQYSKKDFYGEKLKENDQLISYSSKKTLSEMGPAYFNHYKNGQSSDMFTDVIFENTSSDAANRVYSFWFNKLKGCFPELKEASKPGDPSKMAIKYENGYSIELQLMQDVYNKYRVLLTITEAEGH